MSLEGYLHLEDMLLFKMLMVLFLMSQLAMQESLKVVLDCVDQAPAFTIANNIIVKDSQNVRNIFRNLHVKRSSKVTEC